MDPWDEWRKRGKGSPMDDFFKEFDREFQREFNRMREMFSDIFEEANRAARNAAENPGEPFVMGFSFRMGPDGKPHIEQFGNTNVVHTDEEAGAGRGREPLTDVMAGDEEVAITVELPGVEKEDINLHVAEDRVTLRVNNARRKYFKEVDLPCKVIPKTAEATYKNGVLDITLQREERRDSGTRVEIK